MRLLMACVVFGCAEESPPRPEPVPCAEGVISPAEVVPNVLATGDFNADGIVDIASPSTSPNPTARTLNVLLGRGDGSFESPVGYGPYTDRTWKNTALAADLDLDGVLDIVVSGRMHDDVDATSVFFGFGDGTFDEEQVIGPPARKLLATDLDKDGITDLVLASNSVSVLRGSGGRMFVEAKQIASYLATDLDIADLNSDGYTDLVVANLGSVCFFNCGDNSSSPGAINIALGEAGGTFAVPLEVDNTHTMVARVADMNRDGEPDIVNASVGTSYVLLGIGDGTFRFGPRLQSTTETFALGVADFNDDGFEDVASLVRDTNISGSAIFELQAGTEDGFQPPHIMALYGSVGSLAIHDFDRNGRLDIAFGVLEPPWEPETKGSVCVVSNERLMTLEQ